MSLDGVDKLIAQLRNIDRTAFNRVVAAVDKSAKDLQTDAKESVSGPGTGRTYDTKFYVNKKGKLISYGSRPPHTAAAPGQPPATDGFRYGNRGPSGGKLKDGIMVEKFNSGLVAEIGITKPNDFPQGIYQEFGTNRRAKRDFNVAERPWLRPAWNRNKDAIQLAIGLAIQNLFRSAFRSGS